jgi:hypothetical protein
MPSWRLLLIFAALLVFALPHFGHMWRPNATGRFFSQPQPPCDAPWRAGSSVAKWNECQHEQLWLDRPMPLYALHGVRTRSGVLTSVVVALGLLGCLILLREKLPMLEPARVRASRIQPRSRSASA